MGKKVWQCGAAMELLIGLFVLFWFALHGLCHVFTGRYVTRVNQARLALRVVSVVHAALALVELGETVQLGPRLWPPSVYGASFDTSARYWYAFAAAYYIWDLIVSTYTM